MEEYKGKHLYHYTTVESLALILNNKTMRFSSLENVDDLEEVEALDLKDYGKYWFIACYTQNEDEEIPIWNMYSGNGSGIRIRFEANIFDDLNKQKDDVSDEINKEFKDREKYDVEFENKPYNVDYTIVEEKICSKILKEEICYIVDENGNHLVDENENHIVAEMQTKDFSCIGVCKRACWNFQKEVRYRLHIEPKNNEQLYQKQEKLPDLPIRYYDMPIKESILNNAAITLGYNISAGNAVIVNMLVEKYNQENKANIIIDKSELKIRPKY